METKSLSMHALSPGRFVSEEFAVEGRALQRAAHYGHGATVGFEEIQNAIAVGPLVREFQDKGTVGYHAELAFVFYRYVPLEWLSMRAQRCRQRHVLAGEQTDIAALSTGEFQRYHHVANEQRVFEEHPPGGSILRAPVELMKGEAALMFQERRALVAKSIDDRTRTGLIIGDLRAGPLQVSMMVEQLKSAKHPLLAVLERGDEMGGTKEPVLVNQPDDLAVAGGELNPSDLRGALEAGKTGERHASILT